MPADSQNMTKTLAQCSGLVPRYLRGRDGAERSSGAERHEVDPELQHDLDTCFAALRERLLAGSPQGAPVPPPEMPVIQPAPLPALVSRPAHAQLAAPFGGLRSARSAREMPDGPGTDIAEAPSLPTPAKPLRFGVRGMG